MLRDLIRLAVGLALFAVLAMGVARWVRPTSGPDEGTLRAAREHLEDCPHCRAAGMTLERYAGPLGGCVESSEDSWGDDRPSQEKPSP